MEVQCTILEAEEISVRQGYRIRGKSDETCSYALLDVGPGM